MKYWLLLWITKLYCSPPPPPLLLGGGGVDGRSMSTEKAQWYMKFPFNLWKKWIGQGKSNSFFDNPRSRKNNVSLRLPSLLYHSCHIFFFSPIPFSISWIKKSMFYTCIVKQSELYAWNSHSCRQAYLLIFFFFKLEVPCVGRGFVSTSSLFRTGENFSCTKEKL